MERTLKPTFRLRRGAWIAAGALVLCAALAVAPGRARPQEPVPTPGFAVVDLDRAMALSDEWKDRRQVIQDLLERRRRVLERLDRRLRILRSDLDSLPPGTDETLRKRAQAQAALAELDSQVAQFDVEIQDTSALASGAMLRKVREALEKVCPERGIRMVFRKPPSPPAPEAAGDVLYARDVHDITDLVAEQLNAAYDTEIRER